METTLATWPDATRLEEYIHNNPVQALDALAGILSPEQAQSLHAQLFPPATDAEKAAVVEDVRQRLTRAGYAGDSTPLAWAVDELAALSSGLATEPASAQTS